MHELHGLRGGRSNLWDYDKFLRFWHRIHRCDRLNLVRRLFNPRDIKYVAGGR